MALREFFGSLVDSLKESAQVRTVYGEPLKLEDRTIVPVAKAAFGFGSGRLPEATENAPEPHASRAGGGMAATPMGVLEITKEGTQFVKIPDNNPAKIVAAFAAGLVVGGLLVARARRRRELES